VEHLVTFLLVALKELDGTFVSLRGFLCAESTKVASAAGLRVLLAGVQPELAGFQFSNHCNASVNLDAEWKEGVDRNA
jgi:hypothetical protein